MRKDLRNKCSRIFPSEIQNDNLFEPEKGTEFFTEGHQVIKKIESLVSCNEKGMEIVLRMLILLMKGKIPVSTLDSGTLLDRVKDHIHHWVVGKLYIMPKHADKWLPFKWYSQIIFFISFRVFKT